MDLLQTHRQADALRLVSLALLLPALACGQEPRPEPQCSAADCGQEMGADADMAVDLTSCPADACALGQQRCATSGAAQRCEADEAGCGVWRDAACAANQRCDQGVCACADTQERCGDGADNDCDGQIDEGFEALGQECSAGQGVCAVAGQWACDADKTGLVCPATPLEPDEPDERCDQLDNDCDGQVDEGFDLMSDPAHCGACGVTCGAQERCVSGACKPNFVRIEPGTFQMGSPPDEYGRPPTNKENLATVTLTHPFWMQTTEVTQGQWRRLIGNNPGAFKNCGEDCPVDAINLYEIVAYLNALSRAEGLEECYKDLVCNDMAYLGQGCVRGPGTIQCASPLDLPEFKCELGQVKTYDCNGYRLPTDAEWEYAARAGTSSPLSNGLSITVIEPKLPDPGAAQICWHKPISAVDYEVPASVQFHCLDDSDGTAVNSRNCGPHPVAMKQPNAWGLYDMAGNMSERIWGEILRETGSSLTDPVNAGAGWLLGTRGGNWITPAPLCRSAAYFAPVAPEDKRHTVSFRPVRTILP